MKALSILLAMMASVVFAGCSGEDSRGADTRPGGWTAPVGAVSNTISALVGGIVDGRTAATQYDPVNGSVVRPSFGRIAVESVLIKRTDGETITAEVMVLDPLNKGIKRAVGPLVIDLESLEIDYSVGGAINGPAALSILQDGQYLAVPEKGRPVTVTFTVKSGRSPDGFDLSGRRYGGPLSMPETPETPVASREKK